MKKLQLFLWFLSICILEGRAQNLNRFVSKFSQKSPNTFWQVSHLLETECGTDSILGYGFLTPTDSVLGQRKVFKKYGSSATAIYTYEFTDSPLQLYSIDSTAFNGTGQPVFNQFWEYDEDSDAVVVRERTFCYPHAGAVQTDYFFAQDILTSIEPSSLDNVAFDSVILYEKSFFTGLIEPQEKALHAYSPSGQLLEDQTFTWDAFGSMSWYPSSKMNYFYTPSGRIDHTQEYIWNGLDFVLQTTSEYTYDANDSLLTAISTNEITGQPEEKVSMAYNLAANTRSATFYSWDEAGQQWVQTLGLFGDYDAQGRLEAAEFLIDFFGSSDGIRYEFFYQGNSSCPWYQKIYEHTAGGNWDFVGKYYYFPNLSTSTHSPELFEWSVYPNPAKSGVWVKAPPSSFLQISTLQGEVLYRGYTSGAADYVDLKNAPKQLFFTIGQGKTAVTQTVILQE